MNAIKRKPNQAARATRAITDREEVEFLCLTMLGRDAKPGEVLVLRHLRDELWELQEAAVDTKTYPPQKREAED